MKGAYITPNNFQLALDVLRGRWMLSNAEAVMPHALDFLAHIRPDMSAPEYKAATVSAEAGTDAAAKSVKKVAVVPLHGVLTKYWSCGTVSTAEIGADLVELASRDDVVGVVLDIDSPGGACNAVFPFIEAIKEVQALKKPIIVHCDECASAAYWIASQCDAIFMDNPMSQVGSIGAYVSFIDDRENKQTGEKVVTVYAKESEDKNRSYRDALDGKYELCQDELSELVGMFHNSVKAARPGVKADKKGVFTGAMFYPTEAKAAGLADGVKTLSECIENVFIRAEFNN